jgi:hypothetical protein
MTKARLQRERIEQDYQLPAAKRASQIDHLPALYGADVVYSDEMII